MTIEAWVAIITAVITLATIIFQAGQIRTEIRLFGEAFKEHSEKDDVEFSNIYNRVNGHAEDIAGLKARIGYEGERRPKSGGHPHLSGGE